jgi:uncharacterized protein (UPF0254 family)
MVTSFRPKSPFLMDDATLLTVRPVSNLEELYNQWAEYRLEIVEERCKNMIKMLQARKRVGRKFDVEGTKGSIRGLIDILERTERELVDPDTHAVAGEGKVEDATERQRPVVKRKRI